MPGIQCKLCGKWENDRLRMKRYRTIPAALKGQDNGGFNSNKFCKGCYIKRTWTHKQPLESVVHNPPSTEQKIETPSKKQRNVDEPLEVSDEEVALLLWVTTKH